MIVTQKMADLAYNEMTLAKLLIEDISREDFIENFVKNAMEIRDKKYSISKSGLIN